MKWFHKGETLDLQTPDLQLVPNFSKMMNIYLISVNKKYALKINQQLEIEHNHVRSQKF